MNSDTLEWTNDRVPYSFSFEVVIDFDAGIVTKGGRQMLVKSVDDDTVRFATGKAHFVTGVLFGGPDWYEISRRTGAFRSSQGSGACQRAADAMRLF